MKSENFHFSYSFPLRKDYSYRFPDFFGAAISYKNASVIETLVYVWIRVHDLIVAEMYLPTLL